MYVFEFIDKPILRVNCLYVIKSDDCFLFFRPPSGRIEKELVKFDSLSSSFRLFILLLFPDVVVGGGGAATDVTLPRTMFAGKWEFYCIYP